jgi:hypothetical protein
MEVKDVKEENPNKVYNLFGQNELTARFTGWKGPKQITEITIDTFRIDKKIEKVNYCEETDAIEIHYYRSSNPGSFTSASYSLINCYLNCVRVLLLEYADDETIEACSSSYAKPTIHPNSRNGNILVGNP